MNKLFLLSALAVLASLCSCQKQQTDAERDAEVERRVQERLAADKQAQHQQELDQRQADLDAREKALADKEKSGVQRPAEAERSEPESREPVSRSRAPREGAIGYTTFYNKLEPYGDWIETNDYGYVFRPRQAESSGRWRPYTDGRWVYTDAGWTWISEEPFGWATYHYGRWTRLHGIGWVWVPGDQWAPAWVSWRKSDDYVGWAPLPPEARFDQRTGIRNWSDSYYDVGPDQYCFVASREFGAPRVEQTLLPPERNVTIINQTTNVTNITYNNTTIVNEGPSYDEVKAVSREPVQRYRLERNVNVNVSAQLPEAQVRGETVVIAAPVIAAPVANERPTTVKQTVAAAAVDLGWEAISNQEEAKRTRQKMKSEATPPPNAPPKKFVRGSRPAMPLSGPAETTSAAPTSAPSTTMTPAQTAASVAPSTSSPAMTPRTLATRPPVSSDSPPVSEGRGRMRIPPRNPMPTASAAASPSPTPVKQPTAGEEATASPFPEKSPRGGHFQSGGQGSNPRRIESTPSASTAISPSTGAPGQGSQGFKVPNRSQPTQPSGPSTTPSSTVSTPTPPPASSPIADSPAEKLTKQEKKEQKAEMRAERKELKRERKAGLEGESPSATP